jgi:signal transduction histidine kinase
MSVPGPLRDLVRAVATGRDPQPSAEPLPGRFFRWFGNLRAYVPALAPFVALLLAMAAVAALAPYHVGTLETLIVAVLSAVPLILVRNHSLAAWRVAWLVSLFSGMNGLHERYAPWPANPVAIVVLLFVLLVVGYRQPPGVLIWVWLLSISLIWLYLVPSNGVGSTLLFTAMPLVGYLLRRWAQVRAGLTAELAAEQERGVVLTERARIARELHDVVAHHMSLIAVRAETAQYRLGELPEPARGEFAEISKESREALTEMRRLLGVLRSEGEHAPVAPQPGLADLSTLVAAARAAGTPVDFQVEGELTGVPAAADLSAYRIVQESLSNAARHAAGAPVELRLRRTADELVLQISNGPGAAGPANPPGEPGPANPPAAGGPPSPPGEPGQGVRGMRERVTMLGGQLSAHPTGEGGFEVRATLPLGA